MKRFFLLVLCLPSLALAQSPAPYLISERLGLVIDAEERAYFGLFPDVEGFTEARAYAEGDSVRVEIAASPADSVLTMSRSAAEALGRFVETFEQATTAFYNPNWQPVRPYVRDDVPVPYVGDKGSVSLYVDEGYYTGHPVYVGDSLVVMKPRAGLSFEWQDFDPGDQVVAGREIEEVRTYRGLIGSRYAPLIGLPVGLLVNEATWLINPDLRDRDGQAERRLVAASLGAVGASVLRLLFAQRQSYDEAQEILVGEGWFTSSVRPPELPSEADFARRAAARPAPRPTWRSQYGWLDTGVGIALAPSTQTYEFFSNFEPDGTTEVEIDFPEGPALESSAALRPLAWLGVGVGVYVVPTPRLGDTDLREVAYSKPSFRAFADLDLLRLVWSDSPSGLAVGAGMLLAESVVTQSFPENEATTYGPASYELRERGFRPFYSVTAEIAVVPETSLFVRYLNWSAPTVEVPLTEVESVSFPGTTVYRVEAHSVDFRQGGIVIGVRAGI